MSASIRDSFIWPADYDSSREQFRALTERHGATPSRYELRAKGPLQQTLSIDAALFGSSQARRVIVVSSGLHGVEGFIGAAVQLNLMAQLTPDLIDANTALALVHAVNPYGFAHLRRTNEDNIDLNRNFLGDAAPRPQLNPAYPELNPILNPAQSLRALESIRFGLRAGWLILTGDGIVALSKVVAEGQYHYPKGLFYGGDSTAESVQHLHHYIAKTTHRADEVIHIDLHSGLGRFADVNLIAAGNDSDDSVRHWTNQHLRQKVRLETDPDTPYVARGSLGQWYRTNARNKRSIYLCAEFGTLHPVRVLSALRIENQAHHWTDSDSPLYKKAKLRLLRAFAPASQLWRRNCTATGIKLVQRALKAQ